MVSRPIVLCWRLIRTRFDVFQGKSLPRGQRHDQGCLIWALRMLEFLHLKIVDESLVKHSSLSGIHPLDQQAGDLVLIDWLEQARALESKACIVH